jgi:pRiA4b ORF-3-like protein
MTPPSSPSLESWLLETLRDAAEPLTADQILERLPAALIAGERDPRKKLKSLLSRPEVGHAARGRYVYLPSRITGSMLRLPITGREGDDGYLWLGHELVFALWFRQMEWEGVPAGSSAAIELPDGSRSTLTVERMVRNRRHTFSRVPLVAAGLELRDWLREEKADHGDSLLVQVTDAERSHCRISLERLSQRDAERTERRNRELAEAAADVIRQGVRGNPLSGYDLAGWLLARVFYRDECPPDPLPLVLLSDPHFTQDNNSHFALATKWEWVREQASELPAELLETLMAGLIGSPKAPESPPSLSEAERWTIQGIDPIEELRPWLEAAGYQIDGTEEDDTAAAEAELAARREKVYRLRAALKHRPSVQRILEAQGEDTLVDLDDALRRAFGHDTMDHMGGFFVRTGGGRARQTLATINPLGEVMDGEDLELAELDLEPGDAMSYVYDFGDWIEHTIQVEAVVAPEPGATYPRQVGRGTTSGGKRARARKGG